MFGGDDRTAVIEAAGEEPEPILGGEGEKGEGD